MRVLVADTLAPAVPGRLQDLGCEVLVEPGLKGEALTARLAEARPEVLVVRSTKVTGADLAAARSLALVIRAGSGVNTIDLEVASARGVYVANCPGRNAAAVAELALGHLLNLDRRIADNVAALREGRWDKQGFGVARGLKGRRLAVIGAGRIGREVARLGQALGMEVVMWSRSLDDAAAEGLGVARAESPEAAVAGADAVSVHLAATPETRGRLGASVFEAMKPGALFVNTARAEVVDTAAMLAAADAKGIRCGLDVFDDEPAAKQGPFESEVARHPAVQGTHHIGASTAQALESVGEAVVDIVAAYVDGREIPSCVNLASRTRATHVLVVRHADEVGVLARVLSVLREAGHNVEEMQNTVFSGGAAAIARIAVVGEPAADTLDALRGEATIHAATVTPIAVGRPEG